MKILNFKFPSIFKYYVAPARLQKILDKILNNGCEVDDDNIYITIDDKEAKDAFDILNYYRKNSNVSVRDNSYRYDHEIDISRLAKDKLFEVIVQDDDTEETYTCSLFNHYMMNNNQLIVELEIESQK